MKKSFICLFLLLFSIKLFSLDVYVKNTSDYYNYDDFDAYKASLLVFDKLKELSAGTDINFIETDAKVSEDYWNKKVQTTKETIEKEKREFEKQKKLYESMGFILINNYDWDLESRLGKKPNTYSFPLVEYKIKRHYDYGIGDPFYYVGYKIHYSEKKVSDYNTVIFAYPKFNYEEFQKEKNILNSNDFMDSDYDDLPFFTSNFYDEEDEKLLIADIKLNSLDESQQNRIEFLCNVASKTVTGIVPRIKNEDHRIEKPVYVDRIIGGYYYQIDGYSNAFCNISSAKLNNDYSFTVSNSSGLYAYSTYGNLTDNLTDQLQDKKIVNQNWIISSDLQNNLLVSNSADTVYSFKDNKLTKVQKYNLPSFEQYYFKFTMDGQPAITNLKEHYDRRDITVLGKNFEPNRISKALHGEGSPLFVYGYDDTVWVLRNNSVFVYTNDDEISKVIVLEKKINPTFDTLVTVLEDNSFIICDSDRVYTRYDYDGNILWEYDDFKKSYTSFCDYNNGMLLLYSYDGNLLRIAENDAPLPEELKEIQKCNQYLSSVIPEKGFDYSVYLKLASIYEQKGGFWKAFSVLNQYLDYCPGDAEQIEHKLRTELILAKQVAKTYVEKAIDLFDEYGESTADADYKSAMLILEKFKKQFPNDTEINEMYNELKYTFTEGNYIANNTIPELEIETVMIDPIFPALINAYIENSTGRIKIKNASNKTISNIKVTSNIKRYMDFPTESPVLKELEAGKETYIQLYTNFNNKILNLEEDTNLQVQINITWDIDGKRQNLVCTRPVVIYNKSAIIWADTGMLSCFIMPNDKTVSNFTYSAIDSSSSMLLSKKFTQAIRIINGLGQLPLNYVPDPVSPATRAVNNEYAIDTVKYPAVTLKLKGGDCDDMTALFCSALESAGIETALITTPGHIFAAFNTDFGYNQIWENLSKDLLVFNVDDKVWIPIETTLLTKGFISAWKKASSELLVNDEEILLEDFVIVSDVRDIYPPVSYEDATSTIQMPSEKITNSTNSDISNLKSLFDESLEVTYLSSDVRELNSMAKLCHLFNRDDKAIQILNLAYNINPKNNKTCENLALLYSLSGNKTQAEKYKNEALAITNNQNNSKTARAADSEEQWKEFDTSKKGTNVSRKKFRISSKREEQNITTKADDSEFDGFME